MLAQLYLSNLKALLATNVATTPWFLYISNQLLRLHKTNDRLLSNESADAKSFQDDSYVTVCTTNALSTTMNNCIVTQSLLHISISVAYVHLQVSHLTIVYHSRST